MINNRSQLLYNLVNVLFTYLVGVNTVSTADTS